ncbi:MAG: hypothetical protein WCG61_04875 [Chlorobium sp.]
MTTQNEPLVGIQARIEELHNTIAEKEEQIKARTQKLKEDLSKEFSPEHIIRQHPFKAAGATFVAGFVLTRSLKRSKSSPPREETAHTVPSTKISTASKIALSTIGLEVLRSFKELGFTYLQRYLERKTR